MTQSYHKSWCLFTIVALLSGSPSLAQKVSGKEGLRPPVVKVRVEQGRDREIVIEETAPIHRKREEVHRLHALSEGELAQRRSARTEPIKPQKISRSYVVEAIVFKSGITRVNWRSTSGGEKTQKTAYSNFDWHKMYGFQQVENSTHQFSYLLMVQNASAEDEESFRADVETFQASISSQPAARLKGFEFALADSDEGEDGQEANRFMRTVHQFIHSNRRRIHLTIEARKQALHEKRLQEIADRGKPKPPVRVRFSRVYEEKSEK